MSSINLFVLLLLVSAVTHGKPVQDGYFWQVTDFHYDFSYNDNQYSCHGMSLPNPGQFGNYWCDSPWSLVNNSVYAMFNIKPDVDFILWTGDTVLHGSNRVLSYDIDSDILDNATNLIKNVFPNTTVYSTFGNHDYYPSNQFPPGNNDLYNDTLARWGDWINDTSQNGPFLKGAYYTVKLPNGPRLVSLNTNLYFTANRASAKIPDPADQFAWFRKVLQDARKANEKVLVISHIPPGVHTPSGSLWFYPDFNARLLDILTANSDIITSMFFGHDHADGFKVLAGGQGRPSIPLYIAPSVTPWRYKIPKETGPAHNPGVRLVQYDRTTGATKDIFQYYLDLPKANRLGTANWELEYQATKDYGISDLSSASLNSIIGSMKSANSAEFSNYWRWYTVSTKGNLTNACDASCHATIVCGFTHFNMTDFNACKTSMMTSSTTAPEGNTNMLISILVGSVFGRYLLSS